MAEGQRRSNRKLIKSRKKQPNLKRKCCAFDAARDGSGSCEGQRGRNYAGDRHSRWDRDRPGRALVVAGEIRNMAGG